MVNDSVCATMGSEPEPENATPLYPAPEAGMRPQNVVLVRHGITVSQSGGEVRVDDALGEAGKAGARALVGHPYLEPVSIVYVSPLRRALETACLALAKRCVLCCVGWPAQAPRFAHQLSPPAPCTS